jgi:hypothetical protein
MDHAAAIAANLSETPQQLMHYIQSMTQDNDRRQREYKPFLKDMQVLFPGIEAIAVRTAISPPKDIFIDRRSGRSIPLSNCGAGVANTLYIIGRLMQLERQDLKENIVVCFDEPESDLHPALRKRLMQYIATISCRYDNIQWIIATHSPFILSSLGKDDAVVVLDYDENTMSSNARNIDVCKTNDALAAIGVEVHELLSSKAAIFTEGAMDTVFYKLALQKIAEKDAFIRRLLPDVLLLPLTGGGILKYMPPEELVSLHPNIAIVLDSEISGVHNAADSEAAMRKEYAAKCSDCGLSCFIDKEHRALENIYPASALARVCGINAGDILRWPPYGSTKEIMALLSSAGCTAVQSVHTVQFAQLIGGNLNVDEARSIYVVGKLTAWLKERCRHN